MISALDRMVDGRPVAFKRRGDQTTAEFRLGGWTQGHKTQRIKCQKAKPPSEHYLREPDPQ